MSQKSSPPFARMAAGVVAGALVLAVGHLFAAVINPAASPFFAVGSTIIDLTPKPVKDAIIERFGTNDKLVLFISLALGVAAMGALAGVLERRKYWGSAVFIVGGAVVASAALTRPNAQWWFAIPAIAGVAAGIAALRVLTRTHDRTPETTDRRRFLALLGGLTAVAGGIFVGAQYLAQRLRDVAADRGKFLLPAVGSKGRPITAAVSLPESGITPFVTKNGDFYRIDTALQIPSMPQAEWQLRIHGMVEQELVLTFDDLRRRAAVERTITLTCVSNFVGGNLAGNATWTGYLLKDLLAEARPLRDADMVLSRSADGWTAGTPIGALTDGRDSLLAVGMNGEPLPLEHGYPARLIVPGLYGYVSATKWVVDLEVTRFDRASGYWTDRGWSENGPIKTASRIDVPAPFAVLEPGEVVVAGVAWAQHRGVARVEVQVDDGPWRDAELAEAYSNDTWRQWRTVWAATPGNHTLRVRAVDSAGETQTGDRAEPFPNGATGWHSKVVTIR
ncbi:molybdopterin-dependent oxidoreductase [Smaragdicoccus niigatensis]|uniref:molybdopterin-dependent oxidoreductase n=1 Tax=Smaragdicoccus niigatensis TaxID=359359 RepID=UPI0004764F22|nr:molybdopterin-dependent oxidoreductase [Smaragdicoccus niigatensis]